VPLIEPVVGDLVAQLAERLARELRVLAFGLLDGQDVDVVALEEGRDPVDAGTGGVDVPRGDAHGRKRIAPAALRAFTPLALAPLTFYRRCSPNLVSNVGKK